MNAGLTIFRTCCMRLRNALNMLARVQCVLERHVEYKHSNVYSKTSTGYRLNYRVQVCISPMMSVLDKQSTESEMGRYISISLLVRGQMQI